MTVDKEEKKYTREDLIEICKKGMVSQDDWLNRDSWSAQRKLGEALVLLTDGCDYEILYDDVLHTDDKTIWIEITFKGFADFENIDEPTETEIFYLPTISRLKERKGMDWY